MSDKRGLYGPIEPYATGNLEVGEGHTLYYEECGRPDGKPAVFLHGGPGSGLSVQQRGFFNPDAYRAILFDQRGCGQSMPHASVEANDTWRLVEDIDKLRRHLGVEKWLVFGGSWGSTLALAYAQTYPDNVSELVLRGIYFGRAFEVDWFYEEGGVSLLYPDAWASYLEPIPEARRDGLLAAYHDILFGDDEQARLKAAVAWSVWEGATSHLYPQQDEIDGAADPHLALSRARIEAHYFVNRCFLKTADQLLKGIDAIRHIPAVIVQGRYDIVCPMKTAYELHQAWPEADFRLIPDAGHSAFEAGILHELVTMTDKFAGL